MISWISDWIYTIIYSGPARNAPNDGKNIKQILEQKPPDINAITANDLLYLKEKLKKVEEVPKKEDYYMKPLAKDLKLAKTKLNKVTTNDLRAPFYTSPLLNEFNTVFNMGYMQYLSAKKQK